MKQKIVVTLKKAKEALAQRDNLSASEAQGIIDELEEVLDSEKGTPWWVVVLKVLAYAIGLILAGYGTTAAAQTLIIL